MKVILTIFFYGCLIVTPIIVVWGMILTFKDTRPGFFSILKDLKDKEDKEE
jgi:multisubunit Na+/H+ antiporter MnhE subunit